MATANEQLVVISGYAAPSEPGIRLAAFDPASGAVEVVATAAGIENPSYVVVHPTKPWLYAVSEVGDGGPGGSGVEGAVVSVGIDTGARTLQVADRRPSGGGLPCHLELAPSGRWVITSNYGTGSVEVVAVEEDGSLGAIADRQQHHGHGVRPDRQEGPHAHSATFTPDGHHVLVSDLGTDHVVVYRFDDERGTLRREREVEVAPGLGPRHLAFHPDAHHLYVVNELASTVTVYGYDGDGRVGPAQQDLSTRGAGAGTTAENTPAAIAFVAANRRVYASNRGDDTIAAFDLDGDSGRLSLAGVASSGGHWPRDVAVDPTGSWMLVAHQFGGTVAVLRLGRGGEPAVGERVGEVAVPGASCVQFLGPPPA